MNISLSKTSIVVFDGSTWILEGSIDKSYHMVHRKMAKHSEIGEVSISLKINGIKVKENDLILNILCYNLLCNIYC